MAKIGKTFTIDIDIYNWLEQHAKDKNRKVSFVVNHALRQIKRESERWECPVCGEFNGKMNKSCYVLNDGVFCEGIAPKT